MKVFDPKSLCPKCHGEDLSHRYRRRGERLDESWGALSEAEYDLIRTYCRTCGYRWNSLPADAKIIKAQDATKSCDNSYSYETAQDGYVIYDYLGKRLDPWQLVQILENALALSGSL